MKKKTVLTEMVPCVFGPDGYHEVTVTLNENKMLDDIKCGCDEAREETEGLILLGTDEMTTCLGHRNTFIKQCKENVTRYDLPPIYTDNLLYKFGEVAAGKAAELRSKRASEAAEAQRAAKLAAENDHITERLNGVVQDVIGVGPTSVIEIVRKITNDKKVYTIGTRCGKAYRADGKHVPIAYRRGGNWVFPKGFASMPSWTKTISDWGGSCSVCDIDGYRGHCETKGHQKKMERTVMLAAQATSSAGLALFMANPEHEFTYRSNSRKLIGIEFKENEEWNRSYLSITETGE